MASNTDFVQYIADQCSGAGEIVAYMLYLYHVVLIMTDSGCVSFHLCGSNCNSSSCDAFA